MIYDEVYFLEIGKLCVFSVAGKSYKLSDRLVKCKERSGRFSCYISEAFYKEKLPLYLSLCGFIFLQISDIWYCVLVLLPQLDVVVFVVCQEKLFTENNVFDRLQNWLVADCLKRFNLE
jgi:hypothetical protein